MNPVRKKYTSTLLALVFFSLSLNNTLIGQISQTFSFTGATQTFVVPPCVSFMTVELWGAQGTAGTSTAGLGGAVKGVMGVTAGQILSINVGGQAGFNGGGLSASPPAGNGGGASDIRVAPATLLDRVVVAGGGGGGGSTNPSAPGGGGGAGTAVGANFFGGGAGIGANGQIAPVGGVAGGLNGGAGGTGNGSNNGGAGGGGGFNSGGIGGVNSGYLTGGNGVLGIGGNGGGPTGPGGGGGGYYGGGGASGGLNSNAGGGGGSSWTGTLTTPTFTPATRVGNGLVILTYNFNGNGVSAIATPTAICNGSTAILTASGMVSYTWSNGSNASSIAVNPNVTTTYTASGTNSVGCVSSQVLTVTVSSGVPVLSVVSSTNSTCLGKTATLTASGALSYTWTNNVINGVSFTPTVTNTYTVSGQNGCGTTTAVATISISPLPLSAISSPTIICAGSPATLTAVSPGTSYTWQPFGITGAIIAVNPSVTTIYTVSTSDGTCSGVANLTLVALPVPTVNIISTGSTICSGAAVSMTASGGISYTWNPGNLSGNVITGTPNAATLYSVVASNSVGCKSLASQVVIVNSGPSIGIVASGQIICVGSQVNLTASGATSYTWNPGNVNGAVLTDTPATATTYTLMGANPNNSCVTTSTITVSVFTPSVTLSNSNPTICSGSSSTLIASGANSYVWANGLPSASVQVVSPTSTTGYTVTATTINGNLNCVTVNTIQVNVNQNPSVTATANKPTICRNEASTLTAAGAGTYLWSTSAASVSIKVTPTITTTYSVLGTDANGCSRTATVQIKVNVCQGIGEQISSNTSVLIYPNPNNGRFTVKSDSDLSLILYNALGEQIRDIELNDRNNRTLVINNLPIGVYFISSRLGGIENGRKIIVSE